MKCEQYREAIGSDPSFAGGAGHVAECRACQAYQKDMLALDGKIGRALAIDVPALSTPELQDVNGGNVVVLPKSRRVTAPAWLAMAATVLVAAVVGVRLTGGGVEYDSLADEVLAHVDHDPFALRVTDEPVSDSELHAVVAADVANMDHSAGIITYAHSCVIDGNEVPHLVMQGKYGPITILLMPEENVEEAITLEDESLNGVILPVGDGSIAIIGNRDEALEPIEKSVVNSVLWST